MSARLRRLLAPLSAPTGSRCGWAVAESVRVDPADQSASNNMRWRSGSAGADSSGSQAGAMHLVGLLARAVPAAPTAAARTTAAAGTELLYSVEWQAFSSADVQQPAGPAADLSARPAARWQLGDGRAVAVRQRRGAGDVAFAAANLALLREVRGRPGGWEVPEGRVGRQPVLGGLLCTLPHLGSGTPDRRRSVGWRHGRPCTCTPPRPARCPSRRPAAAQPSSSTCCGAW